jgi:hypothetical protein
MPITVEGTELSYSLVCVTIFGFIDVDLVPSEVSKAAKAPDLRLNPRWILTHNGYGEDAISVKFGTIEKSNGITATWWPGVSFPLWAGST